jgi:hypothetical protein
MLLWSDPRWVPWRRGTFPKRAVAAERGTTVLNRRVQRHQGRQDMFSFLFLFVALALSQSCIEPGAPKIVGVSPLQGSVHTMVAAGGCAEGAGASGCYLAPMQMRDRTTVP